MIAVSLQDKLKEVLFSIGINEFAGTFRAGEEVLLACRMQPDLALDGLSKIKTDIETNAKGEIQEESQYMD